MTTDTLRTLFAPLVFVSALGGCAATTESGETQSEPSNLATGSSEVEADDKPALSEMTPDERQEELELDSDPSPPEPAEDPVDDDPTPPMIGHGEVSVPSQDGAQPAGDETADPNANPEALEALEAPEALAAAPEGEADVGEQADPSASQEALAAAPDGATDATDATEEIGSTGQALSTTTGTTFKLTYYVIALRPKGDPNTYTLRDCNGKFLTYASRAFRADAQMQGTARYRDSKGNSRSINIGNGCWVSLPYSQRWGLGAWNSSAGTSYKLRPFRSIAVDKSVMKIGKWYYIKQLDGARMPYPNSTLVHDGCVRAVDTGPAIKGRHIDFYVAYRSAWQKLINGSSAMGGRESVTIYDGANKCKTHIARGY